MLDELRAAVASAMHADIPRRRTQKTREVAESHVAASRSFGPTLRAHGEELRRCEVTSGLVAVSREGDVTAVALAFDEILLLDVVGNMTIAHIPLRWSVDDDENSRDGTSPTRFAVAKLQWLSRCWLLVLRNDGKAIIAPTGLMLEGEVDESTHDDDDGDSSSSSQGGDDSAYMSHRCLAVARHAVDIDGLVWSSDAKFAVVAVEHVGVELRRGTLGTLGSSARDAVCNEPILVCDHAGSSAALTKVAVALADHESESEGLLVCAVSTCTSVTTFRITGRDDVVPVRTFLTGAGVRVAGLFADGRCGNWIVAMVERPGASPPSRESRGATWFASRSVEDSVDEIVLPPLNDVVGGGEGKTIRIESLSVIAPTISAASYEAADVPFSVAVLRAHTNEWSTLARGFVAPAASQTSLFPVLNRDSRPFSLVLWCDRGQAQLISWSRDDLQVVDVAAPQPLAEERILGVSLFPFADTLSRRRGFHRAQPKCCTRHAGAAASAENYPEFTLVALTGIPILKEVTKRVEQREDESKAPRKRTVFESASIRSDAFHITRANAQTQDPSRTATVAEGLLNAAEVNSLLDQFQGRLEKCFQQMLLEAEDRIVERVTKAIQASLK